MVSWRWGRAARKSSCTYQPFRAMFSGRRGGLSPELQLGVDGKRKALRVQRPGGRPASPSIARFARRDQPASRSNGLRTLLVDASLAAIAVFGCTHRVALAATSGDYFVASPVANAGRKSEVFQCDGRIHCFQMRSCGEARYFVRNCPGTRMVGNNDGERCEQQLCN